MMIFRNFRLKMLLLKIQNFNLYHDSVDSKRQSWKIFGKSLLFLLGIFGMFRHSGVGFGFELQPTIFEVVHFRYFEEKIMLISILLGKSGPFRLESQLKKA